MCIQAHGVFVYCAVLFFLPAQEELGDFFRNSRDQAQTHNGGPFQAGHPVGVEDVLQEGHDADQQQQGKRSADGVLHPFVGEEPDLEDRGALGTDSVGPEQFGQ